MDRRNMMEIALAFVVVTVCWSRLVRGQCGHNTTSVRDLLSSLLDPSSYDPTIRPDQIAGEATSIDIDLVLNAVGPVNDLEMDYGVSFYLRQQWVDKRLSFCSHNSSINVSAKRLGSLWVPDLFFPHSKKELRHEMTTPNVLIRLSPDGTVLYSQRISLTLQCIMNLHKFPLDEQTCEIRMESYGHVTDDIVFKWSSDRKSLDFTSNANIPDFEVTSVGVHDCTATYATGTFPCLFAKLRLRRQIGFYLTQTYIPSILIVSLSWVSFWIDHQAIPARISVGLLTVLTITTQSSGARAQLPRVPYVKSIDVWMSACLIFVFAAYMEYAIVTVLSRNHRKFLGTYRIRENKDGSMSTITTSSFSSVTSICNGGNDVDTEPEPRDNDTRGSTPFSRARKSSSVKMREMNRRRDLGRAIDKFSRYAFPGSFMLFNLIYWVYYTQVA